RTVEDVDRILGFAKLTSTDLQPSVQCINFKSPIDNEAFKLMEMNEDMLRELEDGKKLVIRGDRADTAVLCTKNKTYEVRGAETSNLLLLLPSCLMGDELPDEKNLIHQEVACLKHEYFETKLIKPRLSRLRGLLMESPYSGAAEDTENPDDTLYTLESLLSKVQASEDELLAALEGLQAFQLNGHWRVLDSAYMERVLGSIISLKDENAWNLDSIPIDATCEELGDTYLGTVIKHVLCCFGKRNTDGCTVAILEDKVCRFTGEVILKATMKMNLEEFEATWKLAVPEGMNTSLYQLEGLAVLDYESRPSVIEFFSAYDLPEDPNDRFAALFTKRSKWSLDEIKPFIKDIATDKVGISALLTKYTRASTQKGMKLYTSKRPL
ncbi:hypothetical protein CAPTEDRAFT_140107, partial [Capitella teleta]